ncbi:hypothetical protein JKP88DRAFT_249809 [Tribonema minus]|uniref:Uncharacterized protein n=1 Tax=Tribonema minus TaxID=303371 RepID=A0A836C7L1_9STRA|nr:hypothetical protein JKP88DRAFT_249809 [Tribonema minus]
MTDFSAAALAIAGMTDFSAAALASNGFTHNCAGGGGSGSSPLLGPYSEQQMSQSYFNASSIGGDCDTQLEHSISFTPLPMLYGTFGHGGGGDAQLSAGGVSAYTFVQQCFFPA